MRPAFLTGREGDEEWHNPFLVTFMAQGFTLGQLICFQQDFPMQWCWSGREAAVSTAGRGVLVVGGAWWEFPAVAAAFFAVHSILVLTPSCLRAPISSLQLPSNCTCACYGPGSEDPKAWEKPCPSSV